MPDSSSPINPLDAALRPRLDAQYVAWYDTHMARVPLPHQQPWDAALRNPPAVSGGGELLPCETKDIALDSCALRIFYPPQPTTSPPPVLVWYHGGGMVLGSIDGDAAFCARLARVAGCAVASVEYALAPEHAFPRGHEDAWSAFKYVVEHTGQLGVAPRVALGGTSSGANLAACVALRAGAELPESHQPQFVVLGVPVCDNTAGAETYTSWKELANAPGLPADKMLWYRGMYLPAASDRADPRCSPLLADDSTLRASAHKYYISTCGMDVLRSEGDAYAARLTRLGKAVVHRTYPSLPHAIQGLDGVVDAARRYIRDMAVYITEQFGGHAAACALEALYPSGAEVGVPRLDRSADEPWVRMPCAMAVGEAPLYRPEDNTLHYVDFAGTPPALHVLQLDANGDAVGGPTTTLLSDSVSVACFRENAPGYVCATTRGVAFMTASGELQPLKETIPADQAGVRRMNDGAVDVAGRFWITEIDIPALMLGTGRVPRDQACRARLWRYDPDGGLHVMDTDFCCGNGVSWNPDNTIMYLNDSRGLTYAYDFDAPSGAISNKRVLIDRRALGGEPDGMVVDVNGDLWIAVWGTYCLMHYTADGRHVADVRFGAKDMTCPAFGGPGADVLYVASAAVRPNRAEDDMGGHLFKYHAGVKGLPKYRFKG